MQIFLFLFTLIFFSLSLNDKRDSNLSMWSMKISNTEEPLRVKEEAVPAVTDAVRKLVK